MLSVYLVVNDSGRVLRIELLASPCLKLAPQVGLEPTTKRLTAETNGFGLLNKISTSELAKISQLSKSYISQVKRGKRPIGLRLGKALQEIWQQSKEGRKSVEWQKALDLFIKSRREGISPNTIIDYRKTLPKVLRVLGLSPSPSKINHFLNSLSCSLGGKFCYFKDIRAFYNWLYSPRSGWGFRCEENPVTWVDAPKRPYIILPSLTKEQVTSLVNRCDSKRDKTIIALFTESGLRLSELSRIQVSDIDWQRRVIKTVGKGNKEGYAPFGQMSEEYLRAWLAQYELNGNIWGLNNWGISSMLRRLEAETGLTCNPHTFRRTFACLLRKAGVDTMTIKDLGRWESLEMVQRYTRSITFEDAMKHYKAPLG